MGKIGIISDIHGNYRALEEALKILEGASIGKLIVCGDIVGYGRFPNECCKIVRELNCPVVAGNHDWAVAGLTEYKTCFSTHAVKGIKYTKKVITPDNLIWLKELPLCYMENDMFFVHSSLIRPAEWHYLVLGHVSQGSVFQDVRENFAALNCQLCFVGHSHVPAIFLEVKPPNIKVIEPNAPFYELKGRRAIIDVGSVGLPRNKSIRATIVLYDTDTQRIFFKMFTL